MKKRMIQLALALCMLLVVLPMTVAAEAASDPAVQMTKDGNSVTITTENAPAGSLLYFASYADNGQMLSVKVMDAAAANKEFTVSKEVAYSKAFLTEADGREPLSEEETVSFRQEIPAHIFDFGAQQVVTYDPGDYSNGHTPREQVPGRWYANKIGSKVYPPEDSYTIRYKLHGSDEYEPGVPIEAGTYDVTITRPGDGTYAPFEHTYEEVLVIKKAKHGPMALENGVPTISDKSYTWMELEMDWTGAERPSEGATVQFYLTRDRVKYQYSEPFRFSYTEPNTAVIHFDEYDAANFRVGVMVKDDRNFEDFTYPEDYGYYDEDGNWVKYELLPYPTETWLEQDNACDIVWYYEDGPVYTIRTGAELAGLSWLVNVAGIDFEGKTIKLDADISVAGDGYKWSPIGSSGTSTTVATPFKGTFDGQGHTVSDMFIQNDERYAGLFGYLDHATVKNLTVADSQVQVQYNGGNSVGSIAGYADVSEILNCSSDAKVGCLKEDGRVGGIVGYADLGTVKNCYYGGKIEAMGNAGGIVGEADGAAYITLCTFEGEIICPRPNAGGIVGKLTSARVMNCISRGYIESDDAVGGIVGLCVDGPILNCIHYGTITDSIDDGDGVGGIVGIVERGMVYNCVNAYGSSVRGYSRVGGIVGLNKSGGEVYNCYSAGKVKGTSDYSFWNGEEMYVGAIVGRNENNKGWVSNCYYLLNSASNLDGYVGGGGTKNGSKDSEDHLNTGYFTGWSTNVEGFWYESSTASGKASLITILNRWQKDYATNGFGLSVRWVTSPEGYPIPKIDIQ